MKHNTLNLNFPGVLLGQQGQVPSLAGTGRCTANKKKHDWIWNRSKAEALLTACKKYAESAEKSLEDLTEEDMEHISSELSQSSSQCMAKFQEIIHSGTLKPGSWSKAEDEILQSMIRDGKNWTEIGRQINQQIHRGVNVRNGKKCKERWTNYLDPNINRDEWTPQEDLIILQAFQIHGKVWTVIRQHIQNRTETNIKNRLLSLINKAKMDIDSFGSSKYIDIFILKLKCQIASIEKP